MAAISIIILTFNSAKFIKSCLDSVYAQECQDLEVIVVDNGSRDDTIVLIKRNYPQVILLTNEQNLGACKARNQGIEVACGEWILTLDCDIVLKEGFLLHLLKAIKSVSLQTGMIQSKVLNADKKTIYSTGIFLSPFKRFFDIGKGQIDNGQFNSPKCIFGACAAAALYRRQMLKELREDTGYFDERFFFLVEDVDLAWRAQKRGWKALLYPQAVCYHGGKSSDISKKMRQYLCFRNRYFMIKKNETLSGKMKLFFLSFWYEISRIIYLLITNRYLWKLA